MGSPPARQLPLRGHMQTPTQGRSPRFRVAKPLKGFAPLLFRECLRLSLARENVSAWAGRDTNPIATNRQIVQTPNLNATSFGRPFLWEVVDCHFTLPLCSCRVGFSPPTFLAQVLANLCTLRSDSSPSFYREAS